MLIQVFLRPVNVNFRLTIGFLRTFDVNFVLTNLVKVTGLAVIAVILNTEIATAANSGGQPGQFLQYGAGARSFGMGTAYFSVSDDASATYWNPAGLSQLERGELTALHIELFPGTDTTYDFLSCVYPTAKYGVFGANIIRLMSRGYEKIQIAYNPQQGIVDIKSLGTFDISETALTAAYGKKILENVSIGVTGKFIQRSLDTYGDQMFSFDAAMLMQGFNHTLPNLNVGFGIRNLITRSDDNTDDRLPMIFRLGASYRLLKNKLLLSMDMEKNLKAQPTWSFGTEYKLINFVSLRLGFTGESGFRESSAGIGVNYKDYSLDYAFALHDLGMTHRISGTWKFGKSIVQNRDALVKRLIQEASESYRRGNFIVALNRLDQGYNIDPTNKSVEKMYKKLQEVITFIPKATADTDEESSIRKGVASYVEEDMVGAINSLRYAYYKNPQNVKVLQLLNNLERAANMLITEQWKEGFGNWTIIDKKLYDARQSVMDGKYDQALVRCQEIINLEPTNTTAMEIMGSAFFMMQQPDKAREVWQKVLEVDPNNRVVQEFLEELK
jgi:tetratricopeptide (TPR) repeat protein